MVEEKKGGSVSKVQDNGDGVVRNSIYATWREDKKAEAGYSRELISVRTPKQFMDNLAGQPNASEDCYTYLDYFEKSVTNRGFDRFLGTRQRLADVDNKPVFGDYAWMTFTEVSQTTQNLARGIHKLGLAA